MCVQPTAHLVLTDFCLLNGIFVSHCVVFQGILTQHIGSVFTCSYPYRGLNSLEYNIIAMKSIEGRREGIVQMERKQNLSETSRCDKNAKGLAEMSCSVQMDLTMFIFLSDNQAQRSGKKRYGGRSLLIRG